MSIAGHSGVLHLAATESKAAFKSRAAEIGIAEAIVDKLAESNVATFGQYAFIAPNNPSSSDEKQFKDSIEAIMEREVTSAEMVGFRRLWYESHAIAMSDLRNRVERSSADPPKQVPLAERMLRLKKQRDELKGVIIDSQSEPAHALIDKIQSMVDDNCLAFVSPEKCMSREQEILKDKADPVLAFNNDGNIKLSRRSVDLHCDVAGETKLRNALTRRALAFDQVGLLSFTSMELWHNTMFRALQKQPPAGFKFVSIQQVLAADKELFTIVSQNSRGELKIVAGSPAPLDTLFEKHMNTPEVSCYMSPLPAGGQPPNPASSVKGDDPPVNIKGKGDPPRKGGGKGKGPSIAELLKKMPTNCVSKMPDGKFLCLRYQNGQCYHQRKKRCNNGLHKCYYKGCHKDRPSVVTDRLRRIHCMTEFRIHCMTKIQVQCLDLPCL